MIDIDGRNQPPSLDGVDSNALGRGLIDHLVEGQAAGRWILIAFLHDVLHIFLPAVRAFSPLERLWGDAPQASLEDL